MVARRVVGAMTVNHTDRLVADRARARGLRSGPRAAGALVEAGVAVALDPEVGTAARVDAVGTMTVIAIGASEIGGREDGAAVGAAAEVVDNASLRSGANCGRALVHG